MTSPSYRSPFVFQHRTRCLFPALFHCGRKRLGGANVFSLAVITHFRILEILCARFQCVLCHFLHYIVRPLYKPKANQVSALGSWCDNVVQRVDNNGPAPRDSRLAFCIHQWRCEHTSTFHMPDNSTHHVLIVPVHVLEADRVRPHRCNGSGDVHGAIVQKAAAGAPVCSHAELGGMLWKRRMPSARRPGSRAESQRLPCFLVAPCIHIH